MTNIKKAKTKQKPLPSCHDLYDIRDIRIEHPEQTKEIDARIIKEFEQERTIFVLDMSGFSRTVQRFGIIHYLAMIQRATHRASGHIKHDGIVVKLGRQLFCRLFEP